MKEKRHNYIWGLSPANIITLLILLSSVAGTAVLAQYRISEVEKKTESLMNEQKKDKDVQNKIRTDVAVIKSIVQRMERRRRENN